MTKAPRGSRGTSLGKLAITNEYATRRRQVPDGSESETEPERLRKGGGGPINELCLANLGVYSTRRLMEQDYPLLLVTHDADGDWQFLCGTTNDSVLVCLEDVVERFPEVAALADLPLGWRAWRSSPEDGWQTAQKSPEDD
ncbi:MAG TPA: hypothetical protein VGR43_09835 [Dehalococcoidia bacterium]|jgi:hypothetical protein|nr:hypothetical protein [Dehalococcoidia bacterium]